MIYNNNDIKCNNCGSSTHATNKCRSGNKLWNNII